MCQYEEVGFLCTSVTARDENKFEATRRRDKVMPIRRSMRPWETRESSYNPPLLGGAANEVQEAC